MFRDGIDVQAQIRFGRRTPIAVRDALRVRDDFTCTVPGCNRRPGSSSTTANQSPAADPTATPTSNTSAPTTTTRKPPPTAAAAKATNATRDGPAP